MLSGFRIRINGLQLILIVGAIVLLWQIHKFYTYDNYRNEPINNVNNFQTRDFNDMYLKNQMDTKNMYLSTGTDSRNCMRR